MQEKPIAVCLPVLFHKLKTIAIQRARAACGPSVGAVKNGMPPPLLNIFYAKDDMRNREQAMMAECGGEQAGDLGIGGGNSM